MNIFRFNLVTLALIIAVGRAGSITRGAAAMNLAIAAASKRLTDFESQIGIKLFQRRPQGVELTDAGRTIYQDILKVLKDVSELSHDIDEFTQGGRGQVRVWASPTSISERLPDDLARFVEQHPGIALALEERDSPEIITAIRENRADIGVFATGRPTTDIETVVYRREKLVLVVPADHPLKSRSSVAFAEILIYDIVGMTSGTALFDLIQAESSRIGQSPRVRVYVRGVEAMCRMIAAGMGVGILPQGAARRYVRGMRLKMIYIKDEWAERDVYVGVRESRSLATAARTLFDYLKLREPQASRDAKSMPS